jgi:hypothetical protein
MFNQQQGNPECPGCKNPDNVAIIRTDYEYDRERRFGIGGGAQALVSITKTWQCFGCSGVFSMIHKV